MPEHSWVLDLIARDHPVETVIIRTMRQYMPACALTLRQIVTASELPPSMVQTALGVLEQSGAVVVLSHPQSDPVFWLQRMKYMEDMCADPRVAVWFKHATVMNGKRSVAQTMASLRTQPSKPRKLRRPPGVPRVYSVQQAPVDDNGDKSDESTDL